MILVNGEATDTIAVRDRGLAYGDGVFRTLRVSQGRAHTWRRHVGTLRKDCSALALPCPGEDLLARETARVIEGEPDCVVKIIITRGSGGRGYQPPDALNPARIIMTSPRPAYPEAFARCGVAVHLCHTRFAAQPRLAGIKHLNRLENVLARAEWRDASIAEGLMLDHEGHVVSGTMTSLFIVEESGLAAPDLSDCGVDGVTRERVFEAARQWGLGCRIERLPLDRVLKAREVLLGNSVIGLWPVARCGERAWRPGDVAVRLQRWLDDND